MKMYEALDMNGMPIENCPSTDEVAVQQAEPANKRVKLWVVPSYERVIEIEVPVEGSETGETTTETYTETVPASILYRGADGKLHNMDSIAGAPGADGVSPTVKMEELLGENGEKIGVSLSITDKDSTKSVNILDGAKGETGDSGKGIIDIVKTGSAGNVDTYTINFTDGTSTTFTVSNGRENEKTSQLENDSGFITKFVTDLANYYTKNETLSTTEITALIEQKANGERVIVEGTDAGKPDVNPEDINPANTYLVKTTNGYSMWAWISNDWARLGDTDINLSGYYTMGQTDAKFATKAELEPLVKDADLATVAKSGSYNDLADKPSIPSVDGLATVGQVESKVQEAQKATEAKIPDASQFRKKTDAIQYSEISGTPTPYTLPTASATVLGGVKVGQGLSMNGNTLSNPYGNSLKYIAHRPLDSGITETGDGVRWGTATQKYDLPLSYTQYVLLACLEQGDNAPMLGQAMFLVAKTTGVHARVDKVFSIGPDISASIDSNGRLVVTCTNPGGGAWWWSKLYAINGRMAAG